MKRLALWNFLFVSLLAATNAPLITGQQVLPFQMQRQHLIVVRGEVKHHRPLRMQIDTGASHNVLDRRVADKLGLRRLAPKEVIHGFGRNSESYRVLLAGLRLGTELTSLVCWVGDLSGLGVDAILGLDFLGRRSLTIDFRLRRVRFGAPNNLPHEVSFEEHPSLVVVEVRLAGEKRRLSLDTGIPWLLLYKDRVPPNGVRSSSGIRFAHLGGSVRARGIWFSTLQLGAHTFPDLYGYVLPETPPNAARDGNLGPLALGFRRIHLDFLARLFSWEN